MLTVKNQKVEDSYQALVVQCVRHQLRDTCDGRCLSCELGEKLRQLHEEVNNNVQERI